MKEEIISLLYKNGKAKVGDFTETRKNIVLAGKALSLKHVNEKLTLIQSNLLDKGYIELDSSRVGYKVKALYPLHK